MTEKKFGGVAFIISLYVISCILWGCAPATSVVKVIDLNRERYVCKIDPAQFSDYKGKQFLLSSIEDMSKNTDNLYYYNPQRTIGYKLNYDYHSMQQPVVSFFWYALKKGFECTGLKIEESGPGFDGELYLTFNSLTDEEIQFHADFRKGLEGSMSKNYVVTTPKVDIGEIRAQKQFVLNPDPEKPAPSPISEDTAKRLELRAYGMLDSIVTTILNDPDFKKAIFTDLSESSRKLIELKKLKDEGVINEAEYVIKRKAIIDGMK
jgi:hypothetical protein